MQRCDGAPIQRRGKLSNVKRFHNSTIAELRTGRYTHHGLALTHDDGHVHKALLAAHERHLRDWLNLSLAEQHQDLAAYMSGLNVKRVWKAWNDAEPWHAISADEAERRLFAADFRMLLELLQKTPSQS